MPEPPRGTVTFLFSDIEAFTRLLQHLGDRYAERAALHWAETSGEAEIGLQLAGAWCQCWLMHGHLREGQERLARLLELAGASPHTAARAKALTRAGHLADNLSDYMAAHAFFEESLAIRRALGDKGGIAAALNDLGWVAFGRE